MKRAIWVVALLVILAGVGYGGWQYWQDKDAKKDNKNSQQTSTPDPSDGGKYLVIEEWGVRVKKGPNTQDLTYAFSNPAALNGINFGLTSLGEKYPGCLAENTGLSQGITRTTDELQTGKNKNSIKLGGYFYKIEGGGASCFSGDVSVEDLNSFSAARGELYRNLLNIEKVPE